MKRILVYCLFFYFLISIALVYANTQEQTQYITSNTSFPPSQGSYNNITSERDVIVSGNVGIGTNGTTGTLAFGKVLTDYPSPSTSIACWTANGAIGYCSGAVAADGSCSCSNQL